MLKIVVGDEEVFNQETSKFERAGGIVVELEHSLVAISKWESKFHKAFLTSEAKTTEELFEYVRSMLVSPDVDPDVLYQCTQENIDQIQEYIDSPQSATTFRKTPERRGSSETITSELVYYWMVAYNIPSQYEHWHINRLFALIRICNMRSGNQKKMSKNEMAQMNRQENARRRAMLGTSG